MRKETILNRAGVEAPKARPHEQVAVMTQEETGTLEDSYVYVHCYFDSPAEGTLIRIWRTTFLVDKSSNAKSGLVHVENISMAPQWTVVPAKSTFHFLAIFSGLPKSCQRFDFVEEIFQPGGFRVNNIARNAKDVYHITIL